MQAAGWLPRMPHATPHTQYERARARPALPIEAQKNKADSLFNRTLAYGRITHRILVGEAGRNAAVFFQKHKGKPRARQMPPSPPPALFLP